MTCPCNSDTYCSARGAGVGDLVAHVDYQVKRDADIEYRMASERLKDMPTPSVTQ